MHRITHLLMNSLLYNKKMDEATFCEKLPVLDRELERPSNGLLVLGRDLDEADYYSDNVVCEPSPGSVSPCIHTLSLATLLAVHSHGPLR